MIPAISLVIFLLRIRAEYTSFVNTAYVKIHLLRSKVIRKTKIWGLFKMKMFVSLFVGFV